jgi:hypothetical protein
VRQSYNVPVTDPRKPKQGRQQVIQIAVLGLVWAVGVVALVFERGGTGQAQRPQATGTAGIAATAPSGR